MKRRTKVILILLALLLALYSATIVYISRSILHPYDAVSTFDESKAKIAEQYNVSYESFTAPLGEPEPFTVETVGKITLHGWFYENPLAAKCGLIFIHGSGVNRIHSLHFVHTLWGRGCDLAIYDQRTWGESDGDYVTYGFYEKHDLLAVTEWFQERAGVEQSQIGWAGISLGAAVALQAAPLAPDIAFIIADSSYRDLRAAIADRLPSLLVRLEPILVPQALWLAGFRANYSPNEVSPYLAAGSITSPVFLVHSLADTQTLPYQSEDIASQLEENNHILHLTDWGSRHGWDSINEPEKYKVLVDAFLAEYVGSFGIGLE